MKMSSEYDCGDDDNPQNSVNLMNIVGEYPAKYTCSQVLDNKEPVPTAQFDTGYAAAVAAPQKCIGPRIGDVSLHFLSAFFFTTTLT